MLRKLKTQLEEARQQGQKELPAWVQEDERFRLLLRQAEKQVGGETWHEGETSESVAPMFLCSSDSRGAAAGEEGGEDDERRGQIRPQDQRTERQRGP